MERWLQVYAQEKMGKYEISVIITTQCNIGFLCLALIISYITSIGKRNLLFLMTHVEWTLIFVDLNGCSDASQQCVTTKPYTLRYVWSFYLTQHLMCVRWYCVITTKEWLFTKVIFLLFFLRTLYNILKGQHTTNIFNPIIEHIA